MSDSRGRALVFGATGAQGGGVARHLLRRRGWEVHGVTREPESEAAKRLAADGARIVRADLNDAASVAEAVRGMDAIFAITDYWEHGPAEYDQGKRLVQAAIEAGVPRIVLSSLPGIRTHTGGALSARHFDLKHQLEEELRAEGAPVAYVWVAFYYSNWAVIPGIALTRGDDGVAVSTVNTGDAPMPAAPAEDTGGVVAAILEDFARFQGKSVPVTGDLRTGAEYAEIFTEVLAVPVAHRPRDWQTLRAGADGMVRDVADMFEFYRRHGAEVYGDGTLARSLYPQLRDLRTWLSANRERFAHLLDR